MHVQTDLREVTSAIRNAVGLIIIIALGLGLWLVLGLGLGLGLWLLVGVFDRVT